MDNASKNNFSKKLDKSITMQIVTCVILVIIIILFMFISNIIDTSKFRQYTIISDINVVNSVENVIVDNNQIIINGYAFLLNYDSIDITISSFLRSVKTGKEIWLEVKQTARPDVNAYFNSEYNYENTGFSAYTKVKKIRHDEPYEIILNIDYPEADNSSTTNKKTISTNRYILNKKLYSYNPNDFVIPDTNVQSDLLREVFCNGQICFYKNDIGMYVYQYENKMYWIAINRYQFDEDGMTHIPYHLYTSQIDKLPDNRIQYKYDNQDFNFEEFEYTEEITTPYRMAIRDLPDKYSITYIRTGQYDDKNNLWIWQSAFPLDNLVE